MSNAVSASVEGVAHYSSLIARSKGVWDWPKGYLESALPLLRIDADYLASSLSFETRSRAELIGFYSLVVNGQYATLDHLWIEPTSIGQEAGRFAVKHAAEIARTRDLTAMNVWPDPPAEKFYG